MSDYKCPKCGAGLDKFEFYEPMVHRQSIDAKTGRIVADIEPSDEEPSTFLCGSCGEELDLDAEGLDELFGEWVAAAELRQMDYDAEEKKKKTARQEQARKRKKAKLNAQREEYQRDSGFLPPMPRTKKT